MGSGSDHSDASAAMPEDVALGGFWVLLGMRPLPPGRPGGPGRVGLMVESRHLRTLGMMHGGVAASMLDSFLGRAAFETSPPGHHVVTIQLNVHFIRPARPGDRLIADGSIEHSGRRTAVVRGEIRNEAGTLIAAGSGTFMHLPTSAEAAPAVEDGAEG